MSREKVLILEDDGLIQDWLMDRLVREDFQVQIEATGQKGLARLAEDDFDLLLLDNRLPDTTGMQILKTLRQGGNDIPVILMTAYSTVEDAVQAMKCGAYTYLNKPFNMEEMLVNIEHALETTELRREVRQFRKRQREMFGFDRIIGQDEKMFALFEQVEKIVQHSANTILIHGESGTGKDLLAKAIHFAGARADAPFMNITCSALPSTLLESELFGYEKGAFTDAKTQKKGLFESADGGTVLLDEIGEMPLNLQAKLLRFLEEQCFKRVGGADDIQVDVQIIAATHRNLKEMVRKETFRPDLFYRLNVIPVHIPPLRERPGDVRQLVLYFVDRFNQELNRKVAGVSPAAMRLLTDYYWPGNVRELKNLLERAFILGCDQTLQTSDFPLEIRGIAPDPENIGELYPLPPDGIDLASLEKNLVLQALERTHGNQTRAAKLLGMTRDQIKYRVQKFALARHPAATAPGERPE